MKFSHENVKFVLQKLGTQMQIAEKLGYSRSYIGLIMAGKATITIGFIMKVCEVTGHDISLFVIDENNKTTEIDILKEKIEASEKENQTLRQQVDELKNKLIAAMSKQLGIF
jgi:transcriptional regulator with XRE-family HTH domain